ncbi:MAG: hypothetical protein K2K40_08315 [Paramuribaculum sp.]|nr:hypothetical protein [Paramuribaculum sp.]
MSLPLCCSVVAAADTYLKDKLIMSPTPLKIQLLTVAIAAIAATACSTACHEELLVAEAMRQAGDNAGELRALLDRYDDGRRESAPTSATSLPLPTTKAISCSPTPKPSPKMKMTGTTM